MAERVPQTQRLEEKWVKGGTLSNSSFYALDGRRLTQIWGQGGIVREEGKESGINSLAQRYLASSKAPVI